MLRTARFRSAKRLLAWHPRLSTCNLTSAAAPTSRVSSASKAAAVKPLLPVLPSKPPPAAHEVSLVLYHGNCVDGMGAAWAAFHRLGWTNTRYWYVGHGTQPPRTTDQKVALLDFTYPPPQMRTLFNDSAALIVVDHHASARHNLQQIPRENQLVDQRRSGATLAWQFFHPEKPIPRFLEYIEDRDLWKFALPNSWDINLYLQTVPLTLQNFDDLYHGGEEALQACRVRGAALRQYQDSLVEEVVKRARYRTLRKTGHKVAVVSSSLFKSEIGNRLAADPLVDFAIVLDYMGRGQERSEAFKEAAAAATNANSPSNSTSSAAATSTLDSSSSPLETARAPAAAVVAEPSQPVWFVSFRSRDFMRPNNLAPTSAATIAVAVAGARGHNVMQDDHEIPRPNGAVDVAKVAELHGGGGHSRAAGARIVGDIEQLFAD